MQPKKTPGGDGSAGGGEDRQRDLQEPAHHEGRHHPRVQGSHHQGEPLEQAGCIDLTKTSPLKLGEQAHDCEHGQAAHKQTEGKPMSRGKIRCRVVLNIPNICKLSQPFPQPFPIRAWNGMHTWKGTENTAKMSFQQTIV